MTALTVAGTRFKSDVVVTADGEVERLTANIKGHFVQVNRHEQNTIRGCKEITRLPVENDDPDIQKGIDAIISGRKIKPVVEY